MQANKTMAFQGIKSDVVQVTIHPRGELHFYLGRECDFMVATYIHKSIKGNTLQISLPDGTKCTHHKHVMDAVKQIIDFINGCAK